MCGIAGIYASTGVSRDLLLAMAGELAHRGPDGVGLYADGRFGMVNTRLSVVDLAGGDQPLSNETGRLWVMQNGEVYNYPELRVELEAKGHRFATNCDTEVLVHAFEVWGVGFLERLNGDFAVALWDRETRELLLARDRFGVRPLFLSAFGGGLEFASEAKALLRHPGARRTLDPLALVETFTLWTSLPDRSAFKGVRELPAGHLLRFGPQGLIEEKRWWDMPFVPPEETRTESEADLADELRTLLTDAARIRLRADVPVGAYLSGGLDSSAIAALTRDLTAQTRRSFAVGFEDRRFDESRYQDRMVAELGTTLSRIRVSSADIAGAFPRVVALAEKPLLRTAPAPMLRLAERVRREGFKVVLTGEGADELFAGYNIFKEAQVRRFWAKNPDSKLRPLLLKRLYPYLEDLSRSGAFLRHFFGQGLTDTDNPLYSHRLRFENTARCLRFMNPAWLEEAHAQGDSRARLAARLPEGFNRLSGLSQAQYLEIHTFMEGYLLHAQGDRMLMGGSVEGRFPFLDPRVAEFAARLPDKLRLRGLREKYLLREAVAPLLPKEIEGRAKRPYRAPIAAAFTGPDAPEYVRELLLPERLGEAGVFAPEAVSRLLRKAQTNPAALGETDEMAFVGVLSTMLLHEQLVARPSLAPLAIPTRTVVGDRVETPDAPLVGSFR
jgi:asparagine synthase (glutamine-hydrolysing)